MCLCRVDIGWDVMDEDAPIMAHCIGSSLEVARLASRSRCCLSLRLYYHGRSYGGALATAATNIAAQRLFHYYEQRTMLNKHRDPNG